MRRTLLKSSGVFGSIRFLFGEAVFKNLNYVFLR